MPFDIKGWGNDGTDVIHDDGIYRSRVARAASRFWAGKVAEGLNYLERHGALDLLHDNAVRDDSNCDYRTGRVAPAF